MGSLSLTLSGCGEIHNHFAPIVHGPIMPNQFEGGRTQIFKWRAGEKCRLFGKLKCNRELPQMAGLRNSRNGRNSLES
jgi:ribosomal protein L39E